MLDAGLPEQEGADCIAFSSFVESHGQLLIDLSLYISSHNYGSVTRPLYNTIQSFPLPYLTPPSFRAAAKQRTAHLGLSSLDVDTEEEDADMSQESSIIPKSLRRPKNTVTSLLAASPEANARIKLDALATSYFEPLQKIKAEKPYFVSDSQFSSLDCLALGYLSLMLVPELPQPWLAKVMRSKFPALCSWTTQTMDSVFGGSVDVGDALLTAGADKNSAQKAHLPWAQPKNGGALGSGKVFLSSMADSIPVVGQLRRNTRMRQHGGKTLDDELQGSSWQSLAVVGSLIASLGLVAGYMFQQGFISLPYAAEPEKERRPGFDAFGDAGAVLSVYANQLDIDAQRQRRYQQSVPVAEVDIEAGPRGATVTDNEA